MVSIARIAEKLLRQKPFLEEALSQGIINYAALAESLHQEIEREFGKAVQHAAIVMALRRLRDTLRAKASELAVFEKGSAITIKSDLCEISCANTSRNYNVLQKIYALCDPQRGDFLTITTGRNEITIIVSAKFKQQIIRLLEKKEFLATIDDLAALTITLPSNAIETPGIFYLLTRSLTLENINIVEIVSTYGENTLILKDRDVGRSYYILKTLIKEYSV